MARPLCRLIKEDFHNTSKKEFLKMVDQAGFYCKKCGRTAKDEKLLCKPRKIQV